MSPGSPTNLSPTRQASGLVIALAFLAFIVLGFPAGMLGVAWPSIRQSFALSQDQVGALLIASQIGYITSSFLSGWFITRFGNGQLLFIASLMALFGLLGYALAPAWAVMIGVGVLVGFGGGALDAGMNGYFAMNFGPRLMNWLHACFGIGSTLGPILLTALLLRDLSWRWGYATAALIQAGVAIAFLLTLPRWRTQHPDEEDPVPTPTTRRPAAPVSALDVWLGILVFFCIAGLEMSAGQWSFALFTESRGIDLATAGFWVSLYWGSFTAGRILFGIFGNRIPVLAALRTSMAAMILAAAMLWWRDVALISFLGLALMGFALAPLFPLLMTATPQRLGRRRATRVIGYQVAAASFGIALLPGLAGLLAERISLEITGPFLLVAAILLFGFHEWLEWRQPLGSDAP